MAWHGRGRLSGAYATCDHSTEAGGTAYSILREGSGVMMIMRENRCKGRKKRKKGKECLEKKWKKI
jgi:hypothetical protein